MWLLCCGHSLVVYSIFVVLGFRVGSLSFCVVLGILSNSTIILLRKIELVALIVLWLSVFCGSSSRCHGLVSSL